jgi:hypothetical protein
MSQPIGKTEAGSPKLNAVIRETVEPISAKQIEILVKNSRVESSPEKKVKSDAQKTIEP